MGSLIISKGGRLGWGCDYFVGLVADFLITTRHIKSWNTKKNILKWGMNNMGFELSRLQIMEVGGKRYVHTLDICP